MNTSELAKKLMSAANTTAEALDRLNAFPGDGLIDLSQHEGEQVDADITTINEWYELASPANVKRLVDELEGRDALVALQKIEIRETHGELEKARERIAEQESSSLTMAAYDLMAERNRQVTVEGWTPEHDDHHSNGELAMAAVCYINETGTVNRNGGKPWGWPWEASWWKPDTRRRNLVRAGALILAEIERIDRAACINEEAK